MISPESLLFRGVERRLEAEGKRPLSVIRDMIGSQATKAIVARSRFFPDQKETGVWTDAGGSAIIETYPAFVKHRSPRFAEPFPEPIDSEHEDIQDAYICALVAYSFAVDRQVLEQQFEAADPAEGWIWAPRKA
ncbi:hypothetical protein [Rhodovulum euryhalinum]|uniref:hypothetical protein n=1 Tax=Rhodovulum euryhalinum TaxID=35805 RepID=UPI001049F3AC|nr:hypothetical protein [Rhodovulum euryhalinum]